MTDLNVMTRRGRFRHSVEMLPKGSRTIRNKGGTVFLFATDHTVLDDDRTSVVLGAHDMARIDAYAPVTVDGRGDCYVITVRPDP